MSQALRQKSAVLQSHGHSTSHLSGHNSDSNLGQETNAKYLDFDVGGSRGSGM